MGVEVEDSVIHSDAKGQILIPVSNRSTGTVELPPNVAIGSVVALSEKDGTLCEESEVDMQVSQLKSASAANICAIHSESDEQRKRKLASMLQIPKCNLTKSKLRS